MNRTIWNTAIALTLALALTAVAAFPALALDVRYGRTGDLAVEIEPVKPVYSVGERIRFRVKGNEDFYLYLFSIDPDSNQGAVILPNVLQQYNKYKADTLYIVPEKNVEFFSDRPGSEKIVMIASTKKMDVDMGRYAKSGNFFTSDAKSLEADVKALSFRRREKKEDRVVEEVDLVIAGSAAPDPRTSPDPRPAPPREENVAVFVSSDKTDYQLGETMKITFGADQQGYVHLFTVDPAGRREYVTTKPVSGKGFAQVRGRATAPRGDYRVEAVYSKGPELEDAGERGKGIELIGESRRPGAVYHMNFR